VGAGGARYPDAVSVNPRAPFFGFSKLRKKIRVAASEKSLICFDILHYEEIC
jgi:hypothetical protein